MTLVATKSKKAILSLKVKVVHKVIGVIGRCIICGVCMPNIESLTGQKVYRKVKVDNRKTGRQTDR